MSGRGPRNATMELIALALAIYTIAFPFVCYAILKG